MEEKPIKPNGKKKWAFVVLAILVVGLAGYFYANRNNQVANNMSVSFPLVSSVVNNTSFACESLLSSGIISSSDENLTNGIEGSVNKGTDKVALNIKDEKTLTMQTGANISAGIAKGDDMAIIQNDKNKLMAVWFNDNVTSTIVLNKSNGLAVWLKGNSSFPLYDAPYGSVIYMICR